MDQAFIDQIVSNVLAQLQPAPTRPVVDSPRPQPSTSAIELTATIITADLLSDVVVGGKSITIGRNSIVTPSARDWLNSRKITWSRAGTDTQKAATSGRLTPGSSATGVRGRWQLFLHTVTPNVRALHDGLKRQPDGWKVELIGQALEAARLATAAISTAECDGVVVISEHAEVIACRANRNARVRAAVITDRKQLELTRQHLGVNLACINPNGRTFIEMRNLLRDCAATKPQPPEWSE